MLIQTNDVVAVAYKSGEKWAASVVYDTNHHHAGMSLCDTAAVYNSENEALEIVNKAIQDIKETEMKNEN